MAVANITFGKMSGVGENSASAPTFKPRVSEDITIGSATETTNTSTEDKGRGIIRIQAEAVCYISIGPATTVTAVSGSAVRMSAGQTQHFSCDQGDEVSVVTP